MDLLESSTVFPISSVADIFIFQYGGTGLAFGLKDASDLQKDGNKDDSLNIWNQVGFFT